MKLMKLTLIDQSFLSRQCQKKSQLGMVLTQFYPPFQVFGPSRRSHTHQNQQKELASHKGMIIKSGPWWLERLVAIPESWLVKLNWWIFRYTPLAGLCRLSEWVALHRSEMSQCSNQSCSQDALPPTRWYSKRHCPFLILSPWCPGHSYKIRGIETVSWPAGWMCPKSPSFPILFAPLSEKRMVPYMHIHIVSMIRSY